MINSAVGPSASLVGAQAEVHYGLFKPDPLAMSFAKMRSMALGVKVSYAGPQMTSTGTITATRIPLSAVKQVARVGEPGTDWETVPGASDELSVAVEAMKLGGGSEPVNPVPALSRKRELRQYLEPFRIHPEATAITPGAVTVAACEGIYAVSVRASGVWAFMPVAFDGGLYAGGEDQDATLLTRTSVGVIDTGSTAILITAIGLQESARFAIQWKHCMEALPATTTDGLIYRALATPSATPAEGVLDRLARLTSGLVTGVKEALSSEWLPSVLRGAATMALGAASGGTVGAIAGAVAPALAAPASRLALGWR